MNIKKILLLAVACTPLAGCDFFGGDGKADTTLYELKLTTNLDKAKAGIKAELVRERDQDEVEQLLEDGATQEDIDKAGTCVDGTYYFFDQDGINLFEPYLPGYEFLGWFDGEKSLGYLDTNYDGTPEYIWNMNNRNTTLEARYKLTTYEILYMDDTTGPALCNENPATWNVEQGELILKHKDRTDEGLKFDGWTFAMGGNTRYEGYVTALNEEFLTKSNVAKELSNGAEKMTFSLHENYSVLKRNVKLTFDPEIVMNVIVEVTPKNGYKYNIEVDGSHFLEGGVVEAEIEHNAEVIVIPSLASEDYEVDGIYYGSNKVSREVSIRDGLSTAYQITVDRDAEVELRCVPKL